MPPSQGLPPQNLSNPSVSPRNSASPLISADQREESRQQAADGNGAAKDIDPKTGKQRRLFGLGKKKDEKAMESSAMPPPPTAASAMRPSEPLKQPPVEVKSQHHPQPIPIPPTRQPFPSAAAASPSRLRSSSPFLHSPASSEIFERNVQEPTPISTLQGEMSDAHIPSHVITEDHIPPALEASVQAITSENLNPDEVEIVMSASHQPVAASVLEGSTSHVDLTQLQSQSFQHKPSLPHQDSAESEPSLVQQSGILPSGTDEDGASNYGQLDPNDVRRLSFISFADVMQSEHQQQAGSTLGEAGSRDNLHVSNFQPSIASVTQERAASPLRSPRSPGSTHSHSMSGGSVTTPPLGANPSSANPEQSPARSDRVGGSLTGHGELHIETMRQAVRKTASGDLSGVRSTLNSPMADDQSRETRSRTNT